MTSSNSNQVFLEESKEKKCLLVTFTVTALVSPEEYEKLTGEEMPILGEWDDEQMEECITTYASQFSRHQDYFRIIGRRLENVVATDEPWDREHPPASQKEMKIKAHIISEEPVTLKDSYCDAITYSIINESEGNPDSGDFITEVLITVDQERAKKWCDEYYEDHQPEDIEEWNGNIFETCYWGSPDCAIVEDNIAPGGYRDEIDIEYLPNF